ncbi:MAG: hypothetical protein HY286_13230 [Planctomycetes bacterium]|nr:hypothetical protein [Planctomycetota bacterium]
MKLEINRLSLVVVGLSLPVLAGACKSKATVKDAQGHEMPTAQDTNNGTPGVAVVGGNEQQPGGDAAAQQAFDVKVREAKLFQEQKAFLVNEHLTKAKRSLDSGAVQQASDEIEAAHVLAPADERVLALRDQISAIMGDRHGQVGQSGREIEEIERMRREKTRVEIEQALGKARENLAQREFERALSEVSHALDALTFSPYAGEWADRGAEARDLKAKIQAERAADTARVRSEQERIATAKMRDEEAAARTKRVEVIAAKVSLARNAYISHDYRGAREIAELVLREDSRNQQAMDIRDSAVAAEDNKVDEEFKRKRTQAFIDIKREDEEARIFQTKPIELPKAEYWQTISKLRDKRVNLEIAEGESEDDRIIRASLKSKKTPPLKFDAETDIDKVAAYFKDASGFPVLVTPQAKEKAASSKFPVQLDHPIAIESALSIVLSQNADIKWIIKDGEVVITTADASLGAPIPHVHDVNDLIFGLSNFQGPRIMYLQIPGGKNRQGGVSQENPYGAVLDAVQPIPPEEISSLIKETIAPGTWEQPGVHIDQYQGQLVVTHSPDVQRQVGRFLADLRRYTSSMVTIEARFVTISENFLQAIGVDWRGLPNQFDDTTNGLKDNASAGLDNNGPGLPSNAGGTPSGGGFFDNGTDGSNIWRTEHLFDKPLGNKLSENGGLALQITLLKGDQASLILKAVEKNFDVHEVNAQLLSVANNQRSYITVINQQSYIADYNVEVAQASFIADPKIEILQSGVVLDVRPIINYNRKYITLELQPTVARIVQITDFTTTLGGLAGSVTFQLPQLSVQSAFTTAVVPDGGAVLIGGLKTLREIESRAEVPWLGRLPVIGFFFKKEGYDSETENLMVLIRARITDAREAMQNFEKGFSGNSPR